MQRFFIKLERDEARAIFDLAEREKRHPRDQAALLIRRELEAMNLLPRADQPARAEEVNYAAG